MKKNYDVLKEIRKIRERHYEETKNMSMKERMEYYRKGAERFKQKFEQYRVERANEQR
jgi:hypothetical protein